MFRGGGHASQPCQVSARDWPALTELALCNAPFTDALVGVLAEGAVLPQLRTVSLAHGTLTASGVPILQALDITAQTTGNRVLSDPMADVAERVKEGQALAPPLAKIGVFPTMVLQMASIGEESGSLDHMLAKAAEFYEDEVDEMVKGLSSLMEPLIIVILGTLIGGIVVSMYLPIFKLGAVV